MRTVLGKGAYTDTLHRIWAKVFSRMIQIIIPTAVALELKGPKAKSAHTVGATGSGAVARDTSSSGMYSSSFLGGSGGGANNSDKCPVGHGPEDAKKHNSSRRAVSCRSVIEEEQEDALMERLESDSYISAKSHALQAEIRDAESVRSHHPHFSRASFNAVGHQSTFSFA